MWSNYWVVHKATAVLYKFRPGQGVVLVRTIWESFTRKVLASIPRPGFDVQIGTAHILVDGKIFQDKRRRNSKGKCKHKP